MSTPNPAEVIAEALAKHQPRQIWPGNPKLVCRNSDCYSCDWTPAHQASVIAALPDTAIVPRKDIVRIYRAASTLGQQYMMPTHFGADREEAERWFGLQQKMLDGLPGVDTVRLEYQDMWFTDWTPLAAGGES